MSRGMKTSAFSERRLAARQWERTVAGRAKTKRKTETKTNVKTQKTKTKRNKGAHLLSKTGTSQRRRDRTSRVRSIEKNRRAGKLG